MSRQNNIKKQIARIENWYPPDKLITSYQDFLKHRESLPFYRFNPQVFVALINLTDNLWYSTSRISRLSLLQVSRRYIKKADSPLNMEKHVNDKIFKLFESVVLGNKFSFSVDVFMQMRIAANGLLIGIELDDHQLNWLCKRTEYSDFILNRVLRYPKISNVISSWAKNSYQEDYLASRRAEVTSWILDEDPFFKISPDILKKDFEYQIKIDRKIVNSALLEMDAEKAYEKEIAPLFESSFEREFREFYERDTSDSDVKTCPVPKRNYPVFFTLADEHNMLIPDFKQTSQSFYENIELYFGKVMSWSIAYSRLPIQKKITLLSAQYRDDLYPTFFSIGKRLNSVEYFRWLMKVSG
jgi:hypothetical protein